MIEIKDRLFQAFKADHAALGGALNALRAHLLSANIAGIKADVTYIDQTCGAHIAFEEIDFYPALKAFLSEAEIEKMYREHADGLVLIEELKRRDEERLNHGPFLRYCVGRVDELLAHVSECGELFGALGGLSTEAMEMLYEKLLAWRRNAPSWSDFNKARRTADHRKSEAI